MELVLPWALRFFREPTMKYASICSGIEAATAAWSPLGWECAFVSEIDKFPSAVLKHHYPEIPNHGDFTKIGTEGGPSADDDIRLIVGGTPCQSFSVAGLRGGMDDARGNLALEFIRLVDRIGPRWVVWENVPGVLSSSGGRDFGSFLGALGELGYGWAYAVLDAQYFGLAQRRKRVFVVGYLGDWRRAAAVLFDLESVSGNPPPSRETGEGVAAPLTVGSGAGGKPAEVDVGPMGTLRSGDSHTSGVPMVSHAPIAFESRYARNGRGAPSDVVPPLKAESGQTGKGDAAPLVAGTLAAFAQNQRGELRESESVPALGGGGGKPGEGYPAVRQGVAVRRLTPVECERLQGFPDDFTKIPWRGKTAEQCPDGPRYRALGNSMAVPAMLWIGERIQMVESLSAGAF